MSSPFGSGYWNTGYFGDRYWGLGYWREGAGLGVTIYTMAGQRRSVGVALVGAALASQGVVAGRASLAAAGREAGAAAYAAMGRAVGLQAAMGRAAGAPTRVSGRAVALAAGIQQATVELVYALMDNANDLELYRLDGNVWTKVFDWGPYGDGTRRLKVTKDGVLFLMRRQSTPTVARYEFTERSDDGGVTWSVLPVRLSDIGSGSDGVYWAVGAIDTGSSYPPHQIYNSLDQGANWSVNYTPTYDTHVGGSRYHPQGAVDVDPNNPLRILAFGGWYNIGNDTALAVSVNGGVSWTEYLHQLSLFGAGEENAHMVWGQNGRMIAAHHNKCRISVSDDFGATWTQKYVNPGEAAAFAQHLARAGMWLYCAVWGTSGGENLLRSSGNGDSWVETENFSPTRDHYGLAYNSDGERLYVGKNSPTPTTDVSRIKPGSAADASYAGGNRVDLQYDWATKIFGTGAGAVTQKGVAVTTEAIGQFEASAGRSAASQGTPGRAVSDKDLADRPEAARNLSGRADADEPPEAREEVEGP